MLLGKRPRHPIKRTTSMTEFAFDPSKSSPVEFDVSPPSSETGGVESEAAAAAALQPVMPNQRSTPVAALVSTRVTRRHSADYSLSTAAPNFLKSCCLCKRRFIPGRDIYMYRGDSAFCSLECRQQQMSQDERKERLSLALPKKAPVSSAPANGRSKARAEGETTVAGTGTAV